MADSLPVCFLVMTMTCLSMFQIAEPTQSSESDLLLQMRKQLEYPRLLDVWNYTNDLCFTMPANNLRIACEGSSVTELKIVGDKVEKPKLFNGYPVQDRTLSDAFVVDSFFTTVTRLTTLRVLILVSLGIWGPLPDKIHRLHSLEVLDLSSNFFYGAIPPKVSAMTQLQALRLDGNHFNGTIPDWFDSFGNLTILCLQNNSIQGSIPSSISKVASLSELSFSGNNLSGEIPDLSSLSSLEMLDLRDNHLNSELTPMPKLIVTILLSKNLFRGNIPQQYLELRGLQYLDLSFNALEGTPPEGLFSLPNISYLNLADNMLTGSLSSNVICSSQLGFVDLSGNQLSGDLPSCLATNTSRMIVKLKGNCLNIDSHDQHEVKYCEESHMSKRKSNGKGVGVLISVIGGIVLIVLLIFLVPFILCGKNCQRASTEQKLPHKPASDNSASMLSSELLASARHVSQSMKPGSQIFPTYRIFSLEELKEATNNFERAVFIGEGSIGKIYKGKLENGTYVAIICLSLFKGYSTRNLKLRLDLLAKLRHPNLVCLLGHCIDGSPGDSSMNKMFLIYEYVPNGTFRSQLSQSSAEQVLKWPDRLQALIGIAKAVHYLHTGIIPGSVNNRLKTNNILLDEHFIAKLSDYGLSIITDEIYKIEEREEHHIFNRGGSSILDAKDFEDDVYSLGFIVLEVLVGPRFLQSEDFSLKQLISTLSSQEERAPIIDPIVLCTSSQESVAIVISITSKCLYSDSSSRPSVEEVLWNLQYAAQVQATSDGDQRSDVGSQASR